jgi:polyisoprenoid-binding protein YceI
MAHWLPRIVAALVLLALWTPARAAETFAVDPVHSTVIFRVKHMGTSYSYGRFNTISSKFSIADGGTFEVAVKTASVDTGDGKRDQHLRGPDFFNAVQFPTMVFKSVKIAKASEGSDAYDVTGNLTLHGVTRPVTVRFEKTGDGQGMRGERTLGLEGTFMLKRSDFGMKGMTGAVGDDVRVIVSFEGSQAR